MKTSTLFIGTIALALSFSSCQNKSSKNGNEHSSMDMDANSNHMNSQSSSMNSGMMAEMDNMMKDMNQMQMTGNVDNDFAKMMIGHHKGAVDMSQEELKTGKDETLKQMAQKIIDTQKAEIEELETFLASHKDPKKNYDPVKKDDGIARVMDKSMMMMMDMAQMDTASSTGQQYANMMIMHHQAAVTMAEGFVEYGKDAGLISLAKKMIADQNKEIEQFKMWNEKN